MGVTHDSSTKSQLPDDKFSESNESPPIVNKEYVDMLVQGNHKLTKNQFHAFAKATRKRLREGREVEARRRAAAKKKNCKFKPYVEAL